MFVQRKYNTATVTGSHIRVPMVKRGSTDFALAADWTPAAGDVTVSLDGGMPANIATLPTATAVGNTAYWQFPLSAAELTCKQLVVSIADAAPKAVEDNMFVVETFGGVAAMIPSDLAAAVLAVNAAQIGGTAQSGADLAANLDAPISSRLAVAAYVAPDNTGIALANTSIGNAIVGITNAITGINAVQAKTDNLPANPAAAGDPMTLDLAQPVPLVNIAQTVGDALNAARAEGFGKWVVDSATAPPTMTYFGPDGTTPVHVFQLDSAAAPTQRN